MTAQGLFYNVFFEKDPHLNDVEFTEHLQTTAFEHENDKVVCNSGMQYGDLLHLLRQSAYSIRIRKKTDQKKLGIWTLFTQCPKKNLFKLRGIFSVLPSIYHDVFSLKMIEKSSIIDVLQGPKYHSKTVKDQFDTLFRMRKLRKFRYSKTVHVFLGVS